MSRLWDSLHKRFTPLTDRVSKKYSAFRNNGVKLSGGCFTRNRSQMNPEKVDNSYHHAVHNLTPDPGIDSSRGNSGSESQMVDCNSGSSQMIECSINVHKIKDSCTNEGTQNTSRAEFSLGSSEKKKLCDVKCNGKILNLESNGHAQSMSKNINGAHSKVSVEKNEVVDENNTAKTKKRKESVDVDVDGISDYSDNSVEDQYHYISFDGWDEVLCPESFAPIETIGERCQVCRIDLVFMPKGYTSYNDQPPFAAVLSCGHAYHDACLSDLFGNVEPPCVACLQNQEL